MTFLTLFGAAIGIGVIASMIGIGGGLFMVPLLSLAGFVGTTQEAVGTSLAAVIFTSLSSSLAYRRQRVLDLRLGLLLLPTTLLGAWTGAYLTALISSEKLSLAFGVLMLYPAAVMLRGRGPKELARELSDEVRGQGQGKGRGQGYSLSQVLLIGLGAGLASGFFGIGGGIVMVPAMVLLLRLEMVQAVATSLFVMGPGALIGAIEHLLQHHLHLDLALPLIFGIIIGAQLGPRLASHLPQARLRQLFSLVLFYSATNMILKGF